MYNKCCVLCADGDVAPCLVRVDGSALDGGGTDHRGDTDMTDEADEEEFDEAHALAEEQQLRAERRRQAVEDDVNFPDEIETPHDALARVRRRPRDHPCGAAAAAVHVVGGKS